MNSRRKIKTAPAPWVHTGLNIHPRLTRFLKKWGFTRYNDETIHGEVIYTKFVAIYKGVSFWLFFNELDTSKCPYVGLEQNLNDLGSRRVVSGEPSLSEMEKFIRDHS